MFGVQSVVETGRERERDVEKEGGRGTKREERSVSMTDLKVTAMSCLLSLFLFGRILTGGFQSIYTLTLFLSLSTVSAKRSISRSSPSPP
jgi:hypothetical protein